ncbi:MAG: pyrroline-5-carboxylate reductase [Xanthomonadales bacterium]|nr:pyrroline-5-carboxylate reductase [Xanthomonadales bacterium]
MNISFIGGGNMATALIGGILGADSSHAIRVSDPSSHVRARLSQDFGIECHESAAPVVEGTDIIVLATKPQVMNAVLEELAALVRPGMLVISIAAGIPLSRIVGSLPARPPTIRAMPNTPALIGEGISGLCASDECTPEHRRMAEQVLAGAGPCIWIDDETLMDVVTAVSGSGPAYFFLLIEALADAGQRSGLPAEASATLAVHTAYGAGAMARASEHDAAELRRRVTSPGGTTEAALKVLETDGFKESIERAVNAATQRGRELAEASS